MVSQNIINTQNFYQIALNLTLDDLKHVCQLNKEVSELCNEETFWRLYLNKFFLLNDHIEGMTYKQTVQKCYNLISELNSSNIYITAKLFKYFINLDDNLIDSFLSRHDFTKYPMLYSHYIYTNLLPNANYFKLIGDNILSDNIDNITGQYDQNDLLNSFNEDELDIFKFTLNFIEIPTYYLTTDGPIQIPFDIDKLNSIVFDQNLRTYPNIRNYLDALISLFEPYYKIIAIKYLLS